MSGGGAGARLVRALARSAPPFELLWIESRGWASATFAGERHRLCVEAADDQALTDWLAAAPEAEISIPGHLLADLAVAAVVRSAGRASVTLEALTLIEE